MNNDHAKVLQISMDPELAEVVRQQARILGQSISYFVRSRLEREFFPERQSQPSGPHAIILERTAP